MILTFDQRTCIKLSCNDILNFLNRSSESQLRSSTHLDQEAVSCAIMHREALS